MCVCVCMCVCVFVYVRVYVCVCQFLGKMDNSHFFVPSLPKNRFGDGILKI